MDTKEKKKLWCANESLVKLVIRDQYDRLLRPTYSLFYREKKFGNNLQAIVADMKSRLLEKHRNQFKAAFFYNNQMKNAQNNADLIDRINNGQQSSPKTESKVKILVYDLEGYQTVEESKPEDEQNTELKEVIIERMLVRVCKDGLKNKYRTANFYDIAEDKLLIKHNPYRGFYR